MELNVARESMAQSLYFAQGVVERRNTVPILANVLMEATEGSLVVTATNLEIGVRRRCEAVVSKGGAVTVNARKLYEIVREIPAESVSVRSVDEGVVEIKGGRSRFRMVSLDAKDFPNLSFGGLLEGTTLRVSGTLLGGMIDRTIFCVSTDEMRFNLSGVLVEIVEAGELRMIGTDGHRLAVVSRVVAGAEPSHAVIVPRKGLLELRRLLDSVAETEIDLILSPKEVRLRDESVELFVRAVEGEFPDYRQVVPREVGNVLRLSRDEILNAVRRVSLVASERSRGVKLQVEAGKVEVSAGSADLGEASEEIEAQYSGSPLTVGFNARYLIDVLAVHGEGETIRMELTDAEGAGTIRSEEDEDYNYVLMPMRL